MTESDLLAALSSRAARGLPVSLGVMGGTFDPPHLGHTAMADAAAAQLGLDGVLFIPTGRPNFKQGRRIASTEDRLRMVCLAVGERPGCAVSSVELDRPGVTYTYDTLLELGRRCPAPVRLVFVMGADSLDTFPLWHRAADLARMAAYAVVLRTGYDVARSLAVCREQGLDPDVRLVDACVPAVSSTQVRELLAAGGDVRGMLDPAVERYIRERGLYAPFDEGVPCGA